MTAKEIEAALEKLQASLTASTQKIEALEQAVSGLIAKNTDLETELAALKASVDGIEPIKASVGEIDTKIAAAEKRIEGKIKSAGETAVSIAASAGVPPVPEKGTNEDKPAKALTGVSKSAAAFAKKFPQFA